LAPENIDYLDQLLYSSDTPQLQYLFRNYIGKFLLKK